MSYQSDYSGAQVDEAIGKALNPDAAPTQDSTNLVESGGVYDALAPLRSIDSVPTPGSTNLVESGGVYGLVSNRNLLDNWYFVGGGSQQGGGQFPINQREQTSYNTSYQTTIDRWTLFGGSVVLEADGITVTSSPDFGQAFEPSRLPTGTYTASVKTADGKIGSITFTTTGSQFYAGGAMGDTGVTLNFIDFWTSDKSLFSLQCQGVKIAAAKLEKGTVSTIANDAPPNYAEELAKCQRYFVQYKTGSTVGAVGFAYADSTTKATMVVTLPVQMRATPTIGSSGQGLAIQNGVIRYNPTALSAIILLGNVFVFTSPYNVQTGSAVAGTVGALLLRENSTFSLSADL